jgi:hypothetical protein
MLVHARARSDGLRNGFAGLGLNAKEMGTRRMGFVTRPAAFLIVAGILKESA